LLLCVACKIHSMSVESNCGSCNLNRLMMQWINGGFPSLWVLFDMFLAVSMEGCQTCGNRIGASHVNVLMMVRSFMCIVQLEHHFAIQTHIISMHHFLLLLLTSVFCTRNTVLSHHVGRKKKTREMWLKWDKHVMSLLPAKPTICLSSPWCNVTHKPRCALLLTLHRPMWQHPVHLKSAKKKCFFNTESTHVHCE